MLQSLSTTLYSEKKLNFSAENNQPISGVIIYLINITHSMGRRHTLPCGAGN
jgi:hypothetical protein